VTAIFSEKNEKIQSDNEKIYFNLGMTKNSI